MIVLQGGVVLAWKQCYKLPCMTNYTYRYSMAAQPSRLLFYNCATRCVVPDAECELHALQDSTLCTLGVVLGVDVTEGRGVIEVSYYTMCLHPALVLGCVGADYQPIMYPYYVIQRDIMAMIAVSGVDRGAYMHSVFILCISVCCVGME